MAAAGAPAPHYGTVRTVEGENEPHAEDGSEKGGCYYDQAIAPADRSQLSMSATPSGESDEEGPEAGEHEEEKAHESQIEATQFPLPAGSDAAPAADMYPAESAATTEAVPLTTGPTEAPAFVPTDENHASPSPDVTAILPPPQKALLVTEQSAFPADQVGAS